MASAASMLNCTVLYFSGDEVAVVVLCRGTLNGGFFPWRRRINFFFFRFVSFAPSAHVRKWITWAGPYAHDNVQYMMLVMLELGTIFFFVRGTMPRAVQCMHCAGDEDERDGEGVRSLTDYMRMRVWFIRKLVRAACMNEG